MTEQSSMDDARKLLEKFKEDRELANAESLITDNKIEFDYNNKLYRVRLLKLKEKEELYSMKLAKFGQLLQAKASDGTYANMTTKNLIAVLKDRGDIDIDAIDDKIKKIDAELLDLKLSLGEAIEKSAAESILKNYEYKIDILINDKQLLIIQKTNYLSSSLETQLENYEAQFISYLTLESLNDEKWERTFKTFEEFQNCEDETLINMTGTRSMLLQYR